MNAAESTRVLLLFCATCFAFTSPFATEKSDSANSDVVQVQMQNVMYHYSEATAVHIVRLQGELIPTKKDSFPIFDDRMSFVLSIHAAEISINVSALASVLNQYAFAASDAPLKNISLSVEDKLLKIKGRLHSKAGLPFEMYGTLSATPQGEIRIHAEKIKAAHLPLKGLMDLFDVSIAKVTEAGQVKGIRAEGNDLFLDPAQILPPPKIQGKITAVELRGNEIVQIFGGGVLTNIPKRTGNFMAYHGARLRFNKLTMSDTDLVILDMDPRDPFDFFLDRYIQQLAAGYSKTTLAYGLRVFMRDYDKLQPRANRVPASK